MRLTDKQIIELRKNKRFKRWLDQYVLVELFRIKFGSFPHTSEEFPVGNKLGFWYYEGNRSKYRKGTLKLWQVYLLKKFDFVFDPPDHWQLNFKALKKCWEDHSESWPYVYYYTPHLKRLEKWCKDQRLYYSKGSLPQDKIEKLNSINFVWQKPGDVCWQKHYDNVLNWSKSSGRFPKRYSDDPQERFYAIWISKERSKINKGTQNRDRAKKVNFLCKKIGYNPIKFDWEYSWSMYKNWFTKHGVRPRKNSINRNEKRMGDWIRNQNVQFKKGLLSKEHAKKLQILKRMVKYNERN